MNNHEIEILNQIDIIDYYREVDNCKYNGINKKIKEEIKKLIEICKKENK